MLNDVRHMLQDPRQHESIGGGDLLHVLQQGSALLIRWESCACACVQVHVHACVNMCTNLERKTLLNTHFRQEGAMMAGR